MSVARLYAVPTPFNASELSEIDYTQSFDAIFFAHLNHKPNKLTRSGHTAWGFADVSFGPVVPPPGGVSAAASSPNTDEANSGNAYFPRTQRYAVGAVDDDTGQESLPSAEAVCTNDLTLKRNFNTVSWSASDGADRYRVYRADLDGGFGYIGETTGTTFRDDNIIPDLTDGPRVGRNPFTVAGDYPSTVFFVEQRLGYARTLNNPNGMYLSRSADLENMDVSRPGQEDDAITIRLVATKVNSINQVVPLNDLLAFTSDGLFKVMGSNQDYLAATPPPRQRRQNNRGSSRLKPVVADDVAFYTPAVGNDIRAANYTFEIDGYKSDNMSIFSPHFFEGFQIVAWAFADEPLSCIWAVRSDCALLCFTWEREQEVWGWTICTTQGRYLDVGVIPEKAPGSTTAEHRVYFVVERVIDGVTRRFVERMASAKWATAQEACFLDCAFSFDFTDPVTEVFVPTLAGATVAILADGDVYSKRVVAADGRVTIASPSRVWHVGLSYTSLIETLPLVIQSPNGGHNAGKVQQLGNVVLRMVKTRGVKVGRKLGDLFGLKTRTREPLGDPKELLTGDYLAQTEPLASREATIFVEQSNPLPMTVTAIFLDPIQNES